MQFRHVSDSCAMHSLCMQYYVYRSVITQMEHKEFSHSQHKVTRMSVFFSIWIVAGRDVSTFVGKIINDLRLRVLNWWSSKWWLAIDDVGCHNDRAYLNSLQSISSFIAFFNTNKHETSMSSHWSKWSETKQP